MSIETSTECSCGGRVVLSETEGWADRAWRARCGRCYDPTEGAGDRSNLCGFGPDAPSALLAWEEAHDDVIAEEALPEWVSDLALQLSEEAARQRGWAKERALVVDSAAQVRGCMTYGPKRAA